MRILEFARANLLPYTWRDKAPLAEAQLPLVRLPGASNSGGRRKSSDWHS
jgi:hypothetical protein